jgi:cation/acetate symporter
VNKEGAIAGMLVGLFATSIYIFTYLGWFFLPETNMLPNTPDNWLFGISPASFGTVGAILNFATAYIVSSMTKPVPEHIQELVESIRVPKGAGAATGH